MPETSPARNHLFPAIALAALALAANANTLLNGFVFDDLHLILKNVLITDAGYIPEIFGTDAWKFTGQPGNYYRPLMHLLYMANHYVFGLAPWGYHLTNILLHAGATVTVYFLALRLLGESGTGHRFLNPAVAASAVFAVHPVHTESVAWVACMPEVAYSFLYLASLYLYIKQRQEGRGGYYLPAALFFTACLFKEPAVTLPALILVYDYINRKAGGKPSDYIRRYAPFAVAAAAYIILRTAVIGGVVPRDGHPELSGFENVINAFPLFSDYMQKLLLPVDLNAFHTFHPVQSLTETRAAVSLGLCVLFGIATLVAARRSSVVFLCLALIAMPLLPALYIPGVGENAFAERYLYLPSAGFALLAGIGFGRLYGMPALGRPAAAALLLLLALYFAGTVSRNAVWRDGLSLWSDTARKSPGSATARINLGAEYALLGMDEEASGEYRMALEALLASPVQNHNSIGVIYLGMGLVDEAEREFMAELAVNPGNADSHNHLGIIYMNRGEADRALEEFLASLKINPADSMVHYYIGTIYAAKGMAEDAIAEYEISIGLDPGNPDVRNALGVAYFNRNMLDESIAQHRVAIGLDPSNPAYHYRLGLAYKVKGDTDLAIEEYLAALSLAPNAAIHNNLGNAYASLGRLDDAIEQYRAALALEPDNGLAGRNLEMAMEMKRDAGPE